MRCLVLEIRLKQIIAQIYYYDIHRTCYVFAIKMSVFFHTPFCCCGFLSVFTDYDFYYTADDRARRQLKTLFFKFYFLTRKTRCFAENVKIHVYPFH